MLIFSVFIFSCYYQNRSSIYDHFKHSSVMSPILYNANSKQYVRFWVEKAFLVSFEFFALLPLGWNENADGQNRSCTFTVN